MSCLSGGKGQSPLSRSKSPAAPSASCGLGPRVAPESPRRRQPPPSQKVGCYPFCLLVILPFFGFVGVSPSFGMRHSVLQFWTLIFCRRGHNIFVWLDRMFLWLSSANFLCGCVGHLRFCFKTHLIMLAMSCLNSLTTNTPILIYYTTL